MAKQKLTVLTPRQREALFIKLRASSPASLADIAPLLGLSIREALNEEARLREEVALERDLNELKQLLKNGTH